MMDILNKRESCERVLLILLSERKVIKVKKVVLSLLLIVTAIFLFGCSKQISETAYKDLITNLEKLDFSIAEEDVEKDILQGQRKWLTINENENISVYLYDSSEKMEEDASYVDKGGSSYSNGKNNVEISWVSLPHFFKKDNIIVLYVGENPEIINALKELLGAQFAGDEKIVNDRPTVPENVAQGIGHLYEFHFSDRYDYRITKDFSLLLYGKDSPMSDTILLFEKYQNVMDTVKEYLFHGDGMVPYMYKRYWYNLEKGNLMIGTHYYEPDNVEYISYLWSDIEGVKTNKDIVVGSTEKELLSAYTDDLYYLDKEEAFTGSDGLSAIALIEYDFDYAYMWQPFTPETNELRDITFYIKSGKIVAIEIIEPFELRHVYEYDRDAGLQYTDERRKN